MSDSDKYQELIKLHKKVYLKDTIDYLRKLFSNNSFVIESEIPCINGSHIQITKNERCFAFKLEKFNLVSNMVYYQSVGYGLDESFWINNNAFGKIKVDKGVNGFEFKLNDLPYSITGKIHSLKSVGYYANAKRNYRAIIPIIGNSTSYPNNYIENEIFSVDERIMLHGLIELSIINNNIWIYSFDIEKIRYLIIDSKSSILIETFENIIDSIIYSLGIISGKLVRDEIIIMGAADPDLISIQIFSFQRMTDSIISNMEIVSPLLATQVNLDKSVNRTIDKSTFERLIMICIQNQAYYLSIKILTQSNRLPIELKASAYCVSLETIKNNLIENSKGGINPIKYPKIAKKIIRELKSTLSNYEDDQFNSKDVIIKRLEQINQQTNFDTFEKVFINLGIKLNSYDKDCIKLRDQFLHGKIPYYEDQTNELDFIIYRLHFLICALILKSLGFSGYLKNNVIYFKLIIRNKYLNEPMFRRI